jgi:hypothetical protein
LLAQGVKDDTVNSYLQKAGYAGFDVRSLDLMRAWAFTYETGAHFNPEGPLG